MEPDRISPNAPTATALAKATRAASKPKRKLQFAPEQGRVRKVDLPENYEVGDLYRGIDEYVAAVRERRRKQRRTGSRRSRRGKGSRSSRNSAASSKDSSSSSSSFSSSSDSSSSSSSSGSGHGLTIARLKAFFGDSSSSSSSSSSDSDSDSSSSSSSSSSSTSTNANSRRSRSRRFSVSRGNRSRKGGQNRSRGGRSEDSDSVSGSPTSSRAGPLTPYLGPLSDFQISKKRRGVRQQNKRARNAAKRAKKREAQLIKQGRLSAKPSRSARAKAAQARDRAGGVTEYLLFTPMPLPMDVCLTQNQTLEPTPKTLAGGKIVQKRTMKTTSWEAVRQHFHLLRHYLKQVEGQGGDMGVVPAAGSSNTLRGKGGKADKSDRTQKFSEAMSVPSPLAFGDMDFDDGDLALPPPALDLPMAAMEDENFASSIAPPSSDAKSRRPFTTLSLLTPLPKADDTVEPPGDPEMEGRTGVRMSDLPLSPVLAGFGKDFGASPRAFQHLPSTNFGDGRRDTGNKRERREAEGRTKAQRQQKYRAMFDVKEADYGSGSGTPRSNDTQDGQGAWWLNVSCPTYKDMQEISKLFPLHPLTVEDVLQQDPREKVDVFDKLGYYFVVIRAIDERYFRYTSSSVKNADGSPRMNVSSGMASGSSERDKHGFDTSSTTTAAKQESRVEKEESSRSGESSFEMKDIKQAEDDGRKEHKHNSERGITTTMTRKAHVEIVEGVGGKEGVEGISVGASHLYLIVFAHGVISFSFEDVSNHTDRVLRRLLEITQPIELTANWIAHGLYDSVVDAFFPLLSFVQAEVVEIEAKANEPISNNWSKKSGRSLAPKRRRQRALMGSNPDGRLISVEPVIDEKELSQVPWLHDLEAQSRRNRLPSQTLKVRRLTTRVSLRLIPFLPLPEVLLDRMPLFLVKRKQHVTITHVASWEFKGALAEEMRKSATEIDEAGGTVFDAQAAADQSSMLHRIADTRKIVTGMSRLLGPKNDAVKGLRKRLTDLQRQEDGHGTVGAGSRSLLARTEVSMYMSDVHDHILSMLNQLASGEGRLSEIHFSYLSQIDINNRRFRQGTDGVILMLASVTVAVFAMQFSTSLFSMNAEVPFNTDNYPDTLAPWFTVLGFISILPFVTYLYVKYLYKSSKLRVANKKAAR